MIAVYSLWHHSENGESVCYGRYTNENYARFVASVLLKNHGIKVEIDCDFVYTRKYEVDEQINRIEKRSLL